MKKIFLFTILSAFFISCEKEDTATTTQATAKSGPRLVNFGTPGANSRTINGGTILAFDSWQEFEATATDLDNQVEAHDDAFVAQYDNLSLDALDDKEEELGFDAQKPMIDFENAIGFTNSLRKKVNAEQALYLADDILNPVLDPYTKYLFSGSELSLLNDLQQVMIGKELYQFNSDGYLMIKDKYTETLIALANNLGAPIKLPNVEVFTNSTDKGACTNWKATDKDDEFWPGYRKVRLVAKIRSVPFYTKTESMSISLKKKRRGWRESRIHMSVGNQTNLKDKDCNQLQEQSWKAVNTYKKRKRRDNKQHFWGNDIMGAQREKYIIGYFRYEDHHNIYALTW